MDEHIQILEQEETFGLYSAQSIIEHKIEKTKKAKLDLKEGQHFSTSIFEKLKRKNIIYHGLFTQEIPIDIKSTRGTIVIPLIDSEQIVSRILKIRNKEDRDKIGYIQIATIQVLIKSTFKEGIDSPITLIAYDRRIKETNESVLGITMGNLAYKTLKFNLGIKYAIPLSTKNLDNSICLGYKFARKELMEEGDQPFSLTYMVEYVLTNSHHSINFLDQESIYLDKLFEGIAQIKKLPMKEITLGETSNQLRSPVIFRQPYVKQLLLEKPTNSIKEESEYTRLEKEVLDLTKFLKEKL